MSMIQNYLNKLESYLPDELKKDVRDELEASLESQIEDSQETLGRDLNLEETEAMLKKLGHPMQVAAAYLPKQQLIGSDFFPAYKKALEIALAIMAVIIVLLSLPGALSAQSTIGVVIRIFVNVVDKGLYVFAIVTLIFYLMEYYDANLKEIYAWSPKDLKSNSGRLALSRIESGFELIIGVLFFAWWNGAISLSGQATEISLSPEWQAVFLSVNVIIGLSFTLSAYKFILASWNKFSLIAEIILSIAALVIIIQIWQFDQFVTHRLPLNDNAGWTWVAAHIDNVIYATLSIVAGVCVWDITSNARKIN